MASMAERAIPFILLFVLCLWSGSCAGSSKKVLSDDGLLLSSNEAGSGDQPEQVHLAYGTTPDVMVVTWVTQSKPSAVSEVRYGSSPNALPLKQTAVVSRFVDGSREHRKIFMHRATLSGLAPGKTYYYKCGSVGGYSKVYRFTAMPEGGGWSPRFLVYGDLGLVNAQSLPNMLADTSRGMYDLVLHVGDFAYDMDTNASTVGDAFMRMVEPLAARLPYMVCVGNHEGAYNFSNYKARFSMPGYEQNMMFSFNVGPVHVISLSTEFYFFWSYAPLAVVKQLVWLEHDLIEATSARNRSIRPWIITMGHRPMYCSNNDSDDCTRFESRVRIGIPYLHILGLESLLYKYGVDLELWAHEHSYERLWPIYNRKIYNGSYSEPYRNPGAPVHIITGSAGNQERTDGFRKVIPEWSAFRNNDYGYTRMQVFNSSHLYLEQVSDDKGGKVIDHMWLIKDRHGPYTP